MTRACDIFHLERCEDKIAGKLFLVWTKLYNYILCGFNFLYILKEDNYNSLTARKVFSVNWK